MMLDAIVEQRLLQQSTPVFTPAEVIDTLPWQDRVYLWSISRLGAIPLCDRGDIDCGSVCRSNRFAGIWNAYEAARRSPGRDSPLWYTDTYAV